MITRPIAVVIIGSMLLSAVPVEAASWLDARATIQELADAGEFTAAFKLEDTLFDLVKAEFGEASRETAQSSLFMASVYSRGAYYPEAEARILRSLDLFEQLEGPNSISLITPYVALGETYHAAGDFELALGAYDAAKTLSRREYGFLNPAQVPILEKMSDAALGMGQFYEAVQFRSDALDLFERANGRNSFETLDANFRYADWLISQGARSLADRQYSSIYRFIASSFDNDPWMKLHLLKTDAENLRQSGRTPWRFEDDPLELDEALVLMDFLDEIAEPDLSLRAELLVDLGDWNVAFDRSWAIDDAYLEAWSLLSEIDNGAQLRDEWFSQFEIVYLAPLDSRKLSWDEDAPWGYLAAEFEIDEKGRADDVVFSLADPPRVLERAAKRQILNSRFRPRIVDGELVESRGSFAWRYQYKSR